jgi:putative PIN family toxin of toxin-antitoxin system
LLQLAETDDITLVTTPAIMEELREALERPKFMPRIRTLQSSVAELMEAVLSVVEVVQDLPIEPVVKRDPDDDKILACATGARAHWIVSGDDRLLNLKSYREISILTPRQFVRMWDGKIRTG